MKDQFHASLLVSSGYNNVDFFGLHQKKKKKKSITLTSAIVVTSLMWVGVLEKPGSKSNGMLYGIGKASE